MAQVDHVVAVVQRPQHVDEIQPKSLFGQAFGLREREAMPSVLEAIKFYKMVAQAPLVIVLTN